jgi:glycosyltransferase involved in cell wall biosynthesis
MGFKGLPKEEHHDGVRITRVRGIRKHKATCEAHELLSFTISAFPIVVSRLSKNDYDVIHAHFIIPTGLLAFLATRFSNVPIIFTSHGSDIPGYNPDRFSFLHRFTRPLLRLIMNDAASIVSPSLYLKALITEQCGKYTIEHIPNGIDVSRFNVRKKQKRILMAGRILRRKGFQHVLAALRNVDTDFEVHIAGDGPFLDDLKKAASALSLDVTFHGWLDNDSTLLRELYETSSIFCLPSANENASVALLEAMLAGMAVITSNVTGCPETVGETGLLVSPGDTNQIRDALVRLTSSESFRSELGYAARQRVLEFYDWEQVGSRYIELFESHCTRSQEST